MKKYLPFILLGVGVLVAVGAFLFIRSRKKSSGVKEEESALIEVDLKDRPIASLTPTADGHYLALKVEKIKIPGAKSMDYELLYKTDQGITQGVPGTYQLKGDSFEADLLLGSESSGKFRYDEGVEEGTLALRFRNSKGKLLIKFETDFHLQTNDSELTSLDGKFSYILDDAPKADYFVTMETFGVPSGLDGNINAGPYGIFGSHTDALAGEVSLETPTRFTVFSSGKWLDIKNNSSPDLGIFVGLNYLD